MRYPQQQYGPHLPFDPAGALQQEASQALRALDTQSHVKPDALVHATLAVAYAITYLADKLYAK